MFNNIEIYTTNKGNTKITGTIELKETNMYDMNYNIFKDMDSLFTIKVTVTEIRKMLNDINEIVNNAKYLQNNKMIYGLKVDIEFKNNSSFSNKGLDITNKPIEILFRSGNIKKDIENIDKIYKINNSINKEIEEDIDNILIFMANECFKEEIEIN